MFLTTQNNAFHIEQSNILLFEKYCIEESTCTIELYLDEKHVQLKGFYNSLYIFIAQCSVVQYHFATFSILYNEQTIPLFQLTEMRGNKLALLFEEQALYTIGKSSAVVKNKDGHYDEEFSKRLEAVLVTYKMNKPSLPTTTNLLALLSSKEKAMLSPYVVTWNIDYMPKEKALRFLTTLVDSCSLLEKHLHSFVCIPFLQLHNGLKGSNGYFDPSKKTIGLYYKYDRPLLMQSALFHEYGHLLDFHYLENMHYIEERQKVYVQLLNMPTLKQIAASKQLSTEHINYLLCIEEVIARLFESYMHVQIYNEVSTKEFAFSIEESQLYTSLLIN